MPNACGDETQRTADAQRCQSPGPDRLADVGEAACPVPSFIEQGWLGVSAGHDPDERRRLLRELVMRALI